MWRTYQVTGATRTDGHSISTISNVMASSAARSRRCRARARNGLVVLPIEIDEAGVGVLLTHHGLLPAYGTDDRATLAAALEELIERLIAADAAQQNG
jgi:hypothetical protein